MSQAFDDRRRALEESFFHQKDKELMETLRTKVAQSEKVKQLSQASGISDEGVLKRLVELEITPATLAAMALAPLVEVAWSDGKLDERERAAVLKGAADAGLVGGDPSYHLLAAWLDAPPPASLRKTWCDYVQMLLKTIDPSDREQLKREILGRARTVAEASGGILGLVHKVSTSEAAILAELEKVFA